MEAALGRLRGGGKPNCEHRSPVGREGAGGCRSVREKLENEGAASSYTPGMSKCDLLGLGTERMHVGKGICWETCVCLRQYTLATCHFSFVGDE